MSTLPGNPHHDLAESARSAQSALTHATLALAYEQRTANLIAYLRTIDDQTLTKERCAEVATRLGWKP